MTFLHGPGDPPARHFTKPFPTLIPLQQTKTTVRTNKQKTEKKYHKKTIKIGKRKKNRTIVPTIVKKQK
jgi:hypothetical protein